MITPSIILKRLRRRARDLWIIKRIECAAGLLLTFVRKYTFRSLLTISVLRLPPAGPSANKVGWAASERDTAKSRFTNNDPVPPTYVHNKADVKCASTVTATRDLTGIHYR